MNSPYQYQRECKEKSMESMDIDVSFYVLENAGVKYYFFTFFFFLFPNDAPAILK